MRVWVRASANEVAKSVIDFGGWTVTESIAISVWVEGVCSRIAFTVPNARIGFVQVRQAVVVVVEVFSKTRWATD
jgi:hypothetical protein